MLKTIIPDAIVSPGYEGAPALKFSAKGDAAWLLIGKKVYVPQRRTAATVFAPLNYLAPGVSRHPKYTAPASCPRQRLTAQRRKCYTVNIFCEKGGKPCAALHWHSSMRGLRTAHGGNTALAAQSSDFAAG